VHGRADIAGDLDGIGVAVHRGLRPGALRQPGTRPPRSAPGRCGIPWPRRSCGRSRCWSRSCRSRRRSTAAARPS